MPVQNAKLRAEGPDAQRMHRTACRRRRRLCTASPQFLFSDSVEEFEDIRNGRGLASDEVDLWEVTDFPKHI